MVGEFEINICQLISLLQEQLKKIEGQRLKTSGIKRMCQFTRFIQLIFFFLNMDTNLQTFISC